MRLAVEIERSSSGEQHDETRGRRIHTIGSLIILGMSICVSLPTMAQANGENRAASDGLALPSAPAPRLTQPMQARLARAEQRQAPPAPARFCSQCGAALTPGANFCSSCGARVQAASATFPAAQASSSALDKSLLKKAVRARLKSIIGKWSGSDALEITDERISLDGNTIAYVDMLDGHTGPLMTAVIQDGTSDHMVACFVASARATSPNAAPQRELFTARAIGSTETGPLPPPINAGNPYWDMVVARLNRNDTQIQELALCLDYMRNKASPDTTIRNVFAANPMFFTSRSQAAALLGDHQYARFRVGNFTLVLRSGAGQNERAYDYSELAGASIQEHKNVAGHEQEPFAVVIWWTKSALRRHAEWGGIGGNTVASYPSRAAAEHARMALEYLRDN